MAKPDAANPCEILFAHGAGASSASPWMRAWTTRLLAFGHVTTFEYPYMREGRKAPDRLPKLVAAHGEIVAQARSRHPAKLVLAGKSMGSRVGCHLSLETPVDGLVCFGFPLVAAGGGEERKVRDEVLVALRTPILFIAGTRDPLSPLPRLEEVRSRMTAPSELFVVEGGDHSLIVGKRALAAAGQTQNAVDAAIAERVGVFIAGL